MGLSCPLCVICLIRRNCILLVDVVDPFWVRILAVGAYLLFFWYRTICVALLRHPWRSYSVFVIRLDCFIVIAGITLPVLVFPVSSFRLFGRLGRPHPVVCRCACRRMIVVGLLLDIRFDGS